MSTAFIDQVLAGTAKPEDIDDFVSAWHDSKTDNGPISSFLGMTEEEYANWVTDPDVLPHIVEIQRKVRAGRLFIAHIAAQADNKIN